MGTTYSTKEIAEKYGRLEAEKLTRRGYPTTFLRAEEITRRGVLHLDGSCPSEQSYYATDDVRWIAILSE